MFLPRVGYAGKKRATAEVDCTTVQRGGRRWARKGDSEATRGRLQEFFLEQMGGVLVFQFLAKLDQLLLERQ